MRGGQRVRTTIAAAVVIAAVASAAPAAACSVVPGYKVPTGLELAEAADAIVLGVVEGSVSQGDGPWDSEIAVRPTHLIKGAALPERVSLRGYLAESAGYRPTRSDPRELHAPNPDALSGGCNRYVFEKDMTLLLFLKRDQNGVLAPAMPPFARAAEDVASPDAPWVKTVRLYAEIAALPKKERRAALIARRDSLRASTDDPDAALIAAEIDRQLKNKRIPPFD